MHDSSSNKILIIDDNREILLALKLLLKSHFDTVHTATTPAIIHQLLEENAYDLVLLDMNFTPGNHDGHEGLLCIQEILQQAPHASIMCITAYGAVDLAVKAMQMGAVDFIEKPWDEKKLLAAIIRVQNFSKTRKRVKQLEASQTRLTASKDDASQMIKGQSAHMQQIWQSIEKIAPTDANVLLTGENGTGKEVIARALHKLSTRGNQPFIAVDMGAIAPTLFESELFGHTKGAFTGATADKQGWFQTASGGTLFLDEIGNLPVALQAKLLSVLQRREITPLGSTRPLPVDIRLITATNANLVARVQEGKFREDLYYRLNTLHIELPALRHRTDEIPLLANHFQAYFCRKYAIPFIPVKEGVLRRLKAYHWPGNIRELRHTIERAIILSEDGHIKKEHLQLQPLPDSSIENAPKNYHLTAHEKHLIQKAIAEANGNYSQAAKMLGISRRTLYNKIDKYGIQ